MAAWEKRNSLFNINYSACSGRWIRWPEWVLLGLVMGNEVLSMVTNWLEMHGKRLRGLNVFEIVGKRAGLEPTELARLIRSTPAIWAQVDQMILYPNFLHLSHRRGGGAQRHMLLYGKTSNREVSK